MIHSVRQSNIIFLTPLQPPAPAPAQHYFSLTPLQPPAPAPASPTVFFSHTTPVTNSSSSPANGVNTKTNRQRDQLYSCNTETRLPYQRRNNFHPYTFVLLCYCIAKCKPDVMMTRYKLTMRSPARLPGRTILFYYVYYVYYTSLNNNVTIPRLK